LEKVNSFERFFHQHYERFYYFALRFLNDEEDSRDVVNDAMEYVYRNYNNVAIDKWESYALAFIRSRCIDHIRHQNVKERYAQFYEAYADRIDVSSLEKEDERLPQLLKAIEELPEKTRLVLKECYLNNKKYREVAQEMGISEEGVHKNIVRALKIIRGKFLKNSKTR
jgi:RNA polymerase sigma-70 factor (family 1)